jgi:quercetin dioxygenase-like cupin family protein/ketosteroid isomerase-like protein
MKTIASLSLAVLLSATSHAQDPVILSPQYYKVLLENDQVRVLEYRLKPGQKEAMHSHPAGVVYLLSGARVKFSYPDGRNEEKPAAAGETFWREPTTHAVENIGDTEAHAIAVDFKTAKPAEAAMDKKALWDLEHAYWRYLQDNDLSAYAKLWHHNFVGWPSVSAAPVRKDHITDWITAQTSKGLVFKTDEFKSAAIQLTGDVATVYYLIKFRWLDKDGKGEAHILRVTHAWLKTGNDWLIIGGMSMPEPETETVPK